MNDGVKFDQGKAPHDLLASEWLDGTARVLEFGANKYGRYNWAKGMAWSRVFAALMRHLWKWWRGEQFDEETGESHLYHATANLMFLAEYNKYKIGEDDRPQYTRKENNVGQLSTDDLSAGHQQIALFPLAR